MLSKVLGYFEAKGSPNPTQMPKPSSRPRPEIRIPKPITQNPKRFLQIEKEHLNDKTKSSILNPDSGL